MFRCQLHLIINSLQDTDAHLPIAKLLMIGQMHLCTFIYSEEKKMFNEIKIEAWLKEAEKYDFICISEMFVHFVRE